MAHLGKTKTGRRYVQFPGADRKLKTVSLGVLGEKKAQQIKARVEDLVLSAKTGTTLEDPTRRWLLAIDGTLRGKLVRAGLLVPGGQDGQRRTLGLFVEGCLERSALSVSEPTMRRLRMSRVSLLEFFGADRTLDSVTEADAEDFRQHLLGVRHRRRKEEVRGLAEATVRKRCADARMWFEVAVKRRVLDANPFEAVATAAVATEHHVFLDVGKSRAVLEQLPGPEWRLLFCLARWGGVRVVSEVKGMEWGHVDWERGRVLVLSPKTAKFKGKEKRWMPLFPELVEPLREMFEVAKPGEKLVLPMLKGRTAAALVKPMRRAIEGAGLERWPRLFHNLRSTRQTELEARFPTHVVCAWMGNSQAIAQKHYLQVTDDDFERGAGESVGCGGEALNEARSHGGSLGVTVADETPLKGIEEHSLVSRILAKAAVGFEPTSDYSSGFAIRPLGPLGHAANVLASRPF